MDQTIRGRVPFVGVATGPDFLYYKIQFMPESSYGSGNWGELYQGKSSMAEPGQLMEWVTTKLQPGVYWLRLIVADRSGNYPKPCEIRVKVTR